MADPVGAFLNVLSGGQADMSAAQLKAANAAAAQSIKEAENQRQFLKDQSVRGQQFIDGAADSSASILNLYQGQAKDALSSGLAGETDASKLGQSRLEDLMNGGLGGYKPGPDYTYKQQQGEQAIMRGASAQGGRHGSAALQRLMGFNQDLASQDFNQYANRQIGLTNQMVGMDQQRGAMMGQQGQQLAQLYNDYGANKSNILTGAASAKANVGMGLAGNNIQVGQSLMQNYANPVQYAGGVAGAQGAMLMNAVQTGVGIGAYYAGKPQQQGQPPQQGQPQQQTYVNGLAQPSISPNATMSMGAY